MKKLKVISVLFAGLLLFTGCGPSAEIKQKAAENVKTYSQPFKDRISEIYGDDAKLTKIDCDVTGNFGSPVPSYSYHVSGDLTAKLKLNGKTYKAKYDISNGTVVDNVYSSTIVKEMVDSIPIDKSKICATNVESNEYRSPMFASGSDTLEKAMMSVAGDTVGISIVTTEDLSGYKAEDFNTDNLKIISEGKHCYSIRLFSVTNTNKATVLANTNHNFELYNGTNHPSVYISKGYTDAFEYYNIRHAISLRKDNKSDNNYYIDFTE